MIMEKLSSCQKWFLLWVLFSSLAFCLIVLMLYIAGIVWWPTRIRDAHWVQVAGDDWAMTDDGRFFHKEEGEWKKLDLESRHPAVWGMGVGGYSLVIVAKTKVYHGESALPLPVLREPVIAAGNINVCRSTSYSGEIFVASPSEIAIFNWSDKSWVVMPLKNRLSVPVVPAGCNLYSIKGNTLEVIKIEMPEAYAYDSIVLSESQVDVSRYGEISSITSSGQTVWALTTSHQVVQIDWYGDDTSSWVVLPSPPVLENSSLVAGTLGYTFGGVPTDYIDLWLMGEEGVYWYDPEKRAWKAFDVYGRKPVDLSGLTTSSETVGYSVSRLAVVDGILFQQYPLDARKVVWGVLGVPAASIFGIIMVLGSAFSERKTRKRRGRTPTASGAGE